MTEDESWALWGRVGRPHGVKGEVRAFPRGEAEPFEIPPGTAVRVELDNEMLSTRVSCCRGGARFRILDLEAITSREEAEQWRHATLHLPVSVLGSLSDDEVYAHELMGCRVVSCSGEELGVVQSIENYGAGDVLLYGDKASREFLPFDERWVVEVDLGESQIVVNPDWMDE